MLKAICEYTREMYVHVCKSLETWEFALELRVVLKLYSLLRGEWENTGSTVALPTALLQQPLTAGRTRCMSPPTA